MQALGDMSQAEAVSAMPWGGVHSPSGHVLQAWGAARRQLRVRPQV